MKRLEEELRKLLKKESFLVDIILFGSAMKSKERPGDIDACAIFREKNYEKIENILYEITNIGKKMQLKLHCEPLVIDNIYKEPLYASLLHEGYSIHNRKALREMLKFESFILLTYSLKDKKPSDKVRFSYALYGRKKDGILHKIHGKEVGKGTVMVPIDKIEIIRELFRQWNVKCTEQRVVLFK